MALATWTVWANWEETEYLVTYKGGRAFTTTTGAQSAKFDGGPLGKAVRFPTFELAQSMANVLNRAGLEMEFDAPRLTWVASIANPYSN